MSKQKLLRLRDFLKQLSNVRFDDDEGELKGELCLSAQNINWLKDLGNEQIIGGTCEINRRTIDLQRLKDNQIGNNATINVILSEYRQTDCFLAKDLNALIAFGNHRVAPPNTFLLYNDGDFYFYPDSTPTGDIAHYLQLTELLSLLKRYADDSDNHRLIFLHKRKITVRTNGYSSNVLSNELNGFELLRRTLQDEHHQEEKKDILKSTLTSVLSNIGDEDPVEHLVKCFSEFSVRFEEGYRLFVANFSFERVRREHEERYREYVAKLNTTFSEVTNKLISLPITLFLSFTQMTLLSSVKDPAKLEVALMKNIGLVVLSLLVYLFIRELTVIQRSTLSALNTEYVNLMTRLKAEYPSGYSKIKGLESKLNTRYSKLKKGLLFADIIAFISLVVTLALFLHWL